MPRSIWKGAISFGLVTVPVSLYSAIQSKNELSFRLLHRKDASPIDYKRFCQAEGVEVPWADIVKGYEYEKGRYVVVTDEDFSRAKVAATQTFEIRDFVPRADIDFPYFDQPYYLAPSAKAGAKAYALLRDALRDTGRVGIGTIVLRQREHLAALEPAGPALVLTTMRFAHEIRPADSLDLPKEGEGWHKRELDLARQLIDTLAAEWRPQQYKDTYTDAMMEVIKQKLEGKEVRGPAPKKPAAVADLMKALQESLKAPARELAKAPGRASRFKTRRGRARQRAA
jgi:DNA end-binding protein Ku